MTTSQKLAAADFFYLLWQGLACTVRKHAGSRLLTGK
jgi:hypothetical protein